jgi:hypothetical protein
VKSSGENAGGGGYLTHPEGLPVNVAMTGSSARALLLAIFASKKRVNEAQSAFAMINRAHIGMK